MLVTKIDYGFALTGSHKFTGEVNDFIPDLTGVSRDRLQRSLNLLEHRLTLAEILQVGDRLNTASQIIQRAATNPLESDAYRDALAEEVARGRLRLQELGIPLVSEEPRVQFDPAELLN